jgi:hypothetical protein
MKTQSDIREYICKLIDEPDIDPVGFKREALMEYANANTISYIRNFKLTKPKKGKRVVSSLQMVRDWEPIFLAESNIKLHLSNIIDRAWNQLKQQNDKAKGVAMYRLLDKIEAALWVLEDNEAIEFIRSPDEYGHSAIRLMTWFSERYGRISESG